MALGGCVAGSAPPLPAPVAAAGSPAPVSPLAPATSPAPNPLAPAGSPTRPPNPASVRANELGLVPVLMYHQVVPKPKGVYDRTPADFRAELERLAREGYVPVTADAYARGELDVPAGRHPVVLTFDDSTSSQLTLDQDGEPLPDTAVGVLLDVARQRPGFPAVATFFVNGDPFSEPGGQRTLRWLQTHGFEVANHTLTHANLRQLPPAQVQRELAADVAAIREAVPEAPVRTLALPFGVWPRDRALAVQGASGGTSYEHRGVFLVGPNPAPSPYAARFEPHAIPRVRSQAGTGPEASFGSTAWLDKLAKSPGTRYTSDGDPARISFPKDRAAGLDPAYAQRAAAY